jgi:hypothetical protein
MQKRLRYGGMGLAGAIGLAALCPVAAAAYQVQQVGDLEISLHVAAEDGPIANQPVAVWLQIQQGETLIPPSGCPDCRLSLLAPDGQLLNQFDGNELQPIAAGDATGFGTTMIFGAAGDFLVQVEGTVNQQPIDLLFPVPVQE